MFTIEDLQEVKSSGHALFSPERSRLSYELSLMTGTDRGICAEKMLYTRFVRDGWDVRHLGGKNSHDMEITQAGCLYRVEVKLATLGIMSKIINGKKYYGYQFRNVKPDLFDILFLVFVTPDGVLVRWTDRYSLEDWACDKKLGPTGYTITANEKRIIKNLDTLSFNDFYM